MKIHCALLLASVAQALASSVPRGDYGKGPLVKSKPLQAKVTTKG
jgi:hypothetical protein